MSAVTCGSPLPGWACLVMDPGAACVTSLRTCPWLPSARAFGARAFQAGHVRRRYVPATFCSRLRRSGGSGGTCSTPLCPGYLLLAPSALGRFRRDMFDAAMSRLPSARAFGARAFQAGHVRRRYVPATFCSRLRRSGVSHRLAFDTALLTSETTSDTTSDTVWLVFDTAFACDRLHGLRRIHFDHASQRFELFIEHDDHFAVLHRLHCVLQRFSDVEHHAALCLRRFVACDPTEQLRDRARLTASQIVILTNDRPVEPARGDARGMHDQTVITIARHTNHARHTTIFPVAR